MLLHHLGEERVGVFNYTNASTDSPLIQVAIFRGGRTI